MKIVILLILIALAGFSVYSSNANAFDSSDPSSQSNKSGVQGSPVAIGQESNHCCTGHTNPSYLPPKKGHLELLNSQTPGQTPAKSVEATE